VFVPKEKNVKFLFTLPRGNLMLAAGCLTKRAALVIDMTVGRWCIHFQLRMASCQAKNRQVALVFMFVYFIMLHLGY